MDAQRDTGEPTWCSCMCVPKAHIGCLSRGTMPVCVLLVLLVLQLTANDCRHPQLRGGQLHLPFWHDQRPRHVQLKLRLVRSSVAVGGAVCSESLAISSSLANE